MYIPKDTNAIIVKSSKGLICSRSGSCGHWTRSPLYGRERVEPYRSDKPGVRARTSTRGWRDQFVTGSVKKDHFVQLRMHRLQSCISSQYCMRSKWNVGGLYRGRCCSYEPEMKPFSQTTMTTWGGVNGIVDCAGISRKWPCYQSA